MDPTMAIGKKRISCYSMKNLNIYDTIMNGVTLPSMERMREWIEEEKMIMEINVKTINILFYALRLDEFNRVSTSKIAKEI